MSQRRKAPVVSLADFKAKKAEEGSVPIDLGDGEVIRTRSPFTLSDEEFKALNKASNSNDIEGVARIMLGDQYERFTAAGGTSALLAAIIEEYAEVADPESGASSDS